MIHEAIDYVIRLQNIIVSIFTLIISHSLHDKPILIAWMCNVWSGCPF